MSDGMMEAYREDERAKAELVLLMELIDCVADPQRPDENLLQYAKATDEIRGGMIGGTRYADLILSRREQLIQGDETEWVRFLSRLHNDELFFCKDTEGGCEVVDLYLEAKKHSPFAADVLFLEYPRGSRELRELARSALRSNGYNQSADYFVFVLSYDQQRGYQMRPIWVRAIAHRPGERGRTGPYLVKN